MLSDSKVGILFSELGSSRSIERTLDVADDP